MRYSGCAVDPPGACPWGKTCLVVNAEPRLKGNDALNAQFLLGWHRDDPGKSLWSGKNALLVLPAPGKRSAVDIHGQLPASLLEISNSLDIKCDGRPVGTVWNYSSGARAFHFRFHVPAGLPGRLLHVRFSIDQTQRPAEAGLGEDRRELGFAVAEAEVRPRTVPQYLLSRLRHGFRAVKEGLPRRLFQVTVALLHAVGRVLRRLEPDCGKSIARTQQKPGLSVVVLADGRRESIERCLGGVGQALRAIEEPSEVIVLSPVDPGLPGPTGTGSSKWIRCLSDAGLADLCRQATDACRYDWLYVVRAHQVLRPDTLVEALRWRRSSLFAAQSGVVGAYEDPGMAEIRHGFLALRAEPPAPGWNAQGTLYARCGGTLFNRGLLRLLVRRSARYCGAQTHEIEWGLRAWKMGFETLLCKNSVVDCVSSPADDAVGAALPEPDRLRFHLRNRLPGARDVYPMLLRAFTAGSQTRKQVLDFRSLIDYARCTIDEPRHAFPDFPLPHVTHRYYSRPSPKPAVVWVSPFVVFPPGHGGAVRMHRLLRALGREYAVHLVSDEAAAYGSAAVSDAPGLAGLHLVDGRRENTGSVGRRATRIESHSHRLLGETLRMVIASHNPCLVDVQYMELAGLAAFRSQSPLLPWILTLHDVDWDEEHPGQSPDDRYESSLLDRYDHVVVCCPEDARLLRRERIAVIPNGAEPAYPGYRPSPAAPRILFVGPFRSAQNLEGIRAFLQTVYPVILRRIRGLVLTIVGGQGAVDRVKGIGEFGQDGVRIVEYVEDIGELFTQSAVAINPLERTRGSCLKIAECLAADRVCISTRAGARGFLDSQCPSLVVVDTIDDFAEPLVDLLTDPAKRWSLERLDPEARKAMSWGRSEELLFALYREMEVWGRQHPSS